MALDRIVIKPYWTIYAKTRKSVGHELKVVYPESSERLRYNLRDASIIYFPPEQVEAMPDGVGQMSDAVWAELSYERPPFRSTFIAVGMETPTARSMCPIYSATLVQGDGYVECTPIFRSATGTRFSFILGHTRFGADYTDTNIFLDPMIGTDIANSMGVLSRDQAADLLTHATIKLMRCLYLLESANVDLIEAEGAPRAHQAHGRPCYEVVIRQPKHRYVPKDEHEKIDWSHRWEVRGHFKHFTTGPIFRATERERPEKILDHPERGRCVRIWTPPFIKGPEDKPLIPKVRRVVAA